MYQMAAAPCMIQRHRYAGKGAAMYIRWNRGTAWHRYKVVGCLTHTDEVFGPLLDASRANAPLLIDQACNSCGMRIGEEPVLPFWYTVYLPKETRRDSTLILCESCGFEHAAYVQQAGVALPDRDTEASNGAPDPPIPWRLLGIDPPEST